MRNPTFDPCPGTLLTDINDPLIAARVIVARGSQLHGWSIKDHAKYGGALGIIEGLEYHFRQYSRWIAYLEPLLFEEKEWTKAAREKRNISIAPQILLDSSPETEQARDGTHHEAVAYLNRLGQLMAFAGSQQLEKLMPRSSEVLLFRHKHSAHRAIDVPRGETLSESFQLAIAFNGSFQVSDGDIVHSVVIKNKAISFCLRRDHPVIMQEAIALLRAIFPSVQ